jgi:hypothetical protein
MKALRNRPDGDPKTAASADCGWRTLSMVAAVALAIRLVVLLWGYYIHHAENPNWFFLDVWCRWDALHYITIAVKGYAPADVKTETVNYYSTLSPLYPDLLRFFSLYGKINPGLVGIILSVLAQVVSSVLLFCLILKETLNKSAAWFGTLLFCIYPGSYYLNVPYTESIFILFLLLYFSLIFWKPDPLLQGTVLGLAILTRNAGVTLLPLHLIFYLREKKYLDLRQITGFMLPFVAILFLLGLNLSRYGDPFFFLKAGKNIAYAFHVGWVPFSDTLPQLIALLTRVSEWRNAAILFTLGYSSLFLAFATVVIIIGWRTLRWEYRVFSVPYIYLFAAAKWNIANMRYMYPLFPVFIVLSKIRNRLLRGLLCLGSLALLLYFSARFTKAYWVD